MFLKSIIATFDAGIMDENVLNKLKILAESAKYDVSCSSSGTVRSGKAGMLGNTVGGWGICHSFAEDGRCISLLKVMLTNYCIYDCAYCINRRSNDIPRAAFTPGELAELTIEFYRRNYIEGRSDAARKLYEHVRLVAPTNMSVLITGASGTGKEHIAQLIHSESKRSGRPFVAVDCGSVPRELAASEFFGHVKGSFTGAVGDKTGAFMAANGGTLFLDEIGNLPPHLQSKLLTALQSGRIFRVGSNTPVTVDIRLISATNRDLYKMVEQGAFREDLLYRINTIHIDLPPLRQRREDILPLAGEFLHRYAARYAKHIDGFDAEAAREMEAYPWAGNIRELQHTVEKAVILCDGPMITPSTLLLRPTEAPSPAESDVTTLDEMERSMIARAMERCGGNMTEVARQLGITRQTLYNKIKRYGL